MILAAVVSTVLAVRVPENPRAPNGRAISLNVVVLPATERASRDPIFILQGGPGQAASRLADFYAGVFAASRKNRDIVLIDQRGTGESNPLNCDIAFDPDNLFPPKAIAACAEHLAASADPRYYTTAEAVDDLDAVRRKGGYRKIHLYGTSYGVRVALEYVRRYPKHVRSVIVKGVLAPQLRYTVDPAIDTQASLDRVIERARSKYPDLRSDLAKALQSPPPGVTKDALAIDIRDSLHSVPGIRRLPARIHAVAEGKAPDLAKEIADHRAALYRGISIGMYLSVTCAEDMWRVSDADASRLTAGTIPGDYWHRQLAGACAVWPHAAPKKTVAQPVRSSVPALIVSGAFDPVTPPRWGDAVAKMFLNSRHVVVPNGSHSFAGMTGCVDRLMHAFIETTNARALDDACAAKIALPEFE